MSIPRITHQTAASSDLPEAHRRYRRRLRELHPAWEHRFYDDEACRQALRRELPHLLPLYDGYPAKIQRVDLFRVAILYASGGFYLDLDMVCHEPLDPLCEHACVLGEEKTLSRDAARDLGHRHTLRVANYIFGSEPLHPFWLDVLAEMAERSASEIDSEASVLESTGPGLVTDVYHRARDRRPDVFLLRNGGVRCFCGGISCQFGTYASHLHEGSWRWEHTWDAGARPATRGGGRLSGDGRRIRDLLHEQRRLRDAPAHAYVLRTYTEAPHDGLTGVFHRVAKSGTVVDDSRHLEGKPVLVAGIPFLHTDRLSRRNANVVYTTFESSRLPRPWVDAINRHYRHCIVPHSSVKEVFSESGVRTPLDVIGQGFARFPRRPRRKDADGVFRVGFLGVPVTRKNLVKLYRACAGLLREIPSLRLAIHVSRYYEWMDPRAFDELRRSPFVEWTEGTLSGDEVGDWYARLSCYVFPSSGEGWSFTPRESLFLGIPTVLSDIPVHREMVGSGYCTVIPVRGQEEAVFEGCSYGTWGRVETEDIRHAVLRVFERLDEERDRARAGSGWIEDKWLNVETEVRVSNLLRSL